MTETIKIQPTGPIHGSIRPPGSKSITNRALVCAALADGESTLRGALDSDDTRVMTDSLGRLGIEVTADPQTRTLHVVGCGGRIPAAEAHLFVANSGTTVRFLTAMVALGHGTYRLDGTKRMRERPIGDLAAALRQLGTVVFCESPGACPPVVVKAHGLRCGRASIAGNISSQYLSGLLMTIPCAQGPVQLTVKGELVSKPYIDMTLAVMGAFGVEVEHEALQRYRTEGRQAYRPTDYSIEPDASAASYFFAAAAITGGEVTVEGLSESSLQGDVAFCECLRKMGCEVRYDADSITVTGKALRGIEVDMNPISDTVQTLAAVALFAEGSTRLTGVAHIRHKETDRISALVTELRKLGAEVEEFPDGMRITPATLHAAEIDTYDDHRMAMSLALVGLQTPGVVIRDPSCTAKTYPEFFQDLTKLAGS